MGFGGCRGLLQPRLPLPAPASVVVAAPGTGVAAMRLHRVRKGLSVLIRLEVAAHEASRWPCWGFGVVGMVLVVSVVVVYGVGSRCWS